MHVLQFFLMINSRLKRTTDVMFGGKQVLVCGYGEVGLWSTSTKLLLLVCEASQVFLLAGGQVHAG